MRIDRLAGTLLLTTAVACQTSHPSESTLAPPIEMKPVSPAVQTFQQGSVSIVFDYPSQWTTDHGATAIFVVTSPDKSAKLSLDVPSLPFHFPGMITPTAVANGYINDVKKRLSNPTVAQNYAVTVPNAGARRVTITGTKAGQPTTDLAVLMVHNDKVYILSSDGTGTAAADLAGKTLDAAVQSIHWRD